MSGTGNLGGAAADYRATPGATATTTTTTATTNGGGGGSIADLLGTLVDQVSTLVRKEIQLARAEVGEKVGQVGAAGASLGVAAAFLVGAMIAALHFLALAITAFFALAPHWSYLIVAALLGAVGFVLLNGATARLKAQSLTPERTVNQLSRDAQVAKEAVR